MSSRWFRGNVCHKPNGLKRMSVTKQGLKGMSVTKQRVLRECISLKNGLKRMCATKKVRACLLENKKLKG